jgi:hypothetical protein
VCLNSSAVESIASLLTISFERLAAEAPRHRDRLSVALAAKRIELRVDGETSWVTSDGSVLDVGERPEDTIATAVITTNSTTILAVLDAERSLAEAVEAGDVLVLAPLAELERLREALLIYIHGGVRSSSFAELIARLRTRALTLTGTGDRHD